MSGLRALSSIEIGRVSLTERALFAKHLAIMLRSGLTLTEALSVARDASRGKLRSVIGAVLTAAERGRPLSAALGDHPHVFPRFFVEAIRAGEASGTLSENLENVAVALEKEKELVMKVRGAMMYPMVVLAAALLLGLGVAFFILPKIIPLFEGLRVNLPLSTRVLIAFSHVVDDYGLWLFGGVIAGVVALIILLRSAFLRPVVHSLILRLPVVGPIVRGSNLVRMTRTLGMLLKGGLPVDEAIAITRDAASNVHFRSALGAVAERVSKGAKLSEGLAEYPKLFPVIVSRMVGVGEESGRFEDTLFYLAHFYEAEVDNATKNLATAIEPLLLLLIGIVVGGLALAIITPIYEITGNIQR